MELFVNTLTNGLAIAFQPTSLLYVVVGTLWGIIAGALPGVTASLGLALALPFTFGMSTEQSIILLTGIYVGSQFGNSIPAILIKTPGTPSAVLVVVEGYEFHKRGESGRALGLSLVSSTIGQFLSILAFIALVVPLSSVAVYFLAPEIFALAVLGLACVASLTGKNHVKGIIAAAFGIVLSTVGPDPVTSQLRFYLGNPELQVGLGLVPVLVGMLAMSEVFGSFRQIISWEKITGKFSAALPSLSDLRLCSRPILIGTIIGVFIGALPGAAADIAAFISYQQAKQWAKEPEKWGKGSPEALTAADSANNASVGGGMIPTLGLGIPGDPPHIFIMAALIIQGITPGPMLLKNNPEALYAAFGGLLTATLAMFVLGLLLIRPSVYIATLSKPAVTVGTLSLVIVGVYSMNWSLFDVGLAMLMGIVGYFMYRYGYSVGATALGFVLGGLAERSLRQGLVMVRSNYWVFFSRPLTASILLIAILTTAYPYLSQRLAERRQAGAVEASDKEIGLTVTDPSENAGEKRG